MTQIMTPSTPPPSTPPPSPTASPPAHPQPHGISHNEAREDAIVILTTGGTIDKYYSVAGELEIGDPAVSRILDNGLVTCPTVLDPLLRKDSLDLTDADRDLITGRISAFVTQGHARFVITHGTDTMTDTAEHLHRHGADHAATIVLTGAMQPACMQNTDAAMNIGLALAAAQLLRPGIYICMNGRVFPAAATTKDREAGRFIDHPRQITDDG